MMVQLSQAALITVLLSIVFGFASVALVVLIAVLMAYLIST